MEDDIHRKGTHGVAIITPMKKQPMFEFKSSSMPVTLTVESEEREAGGGQNG